MSAPTGAVSTPAIVGLCRRLRTASRLLETGVLLVVAGSALAIGSVHPWAYVPLWIACLLLGLVFALRTWLAARLRSRLGPTSFFLHPSERWIVLGEEPPYGLPTWSFDLGRPLLPGAPLLLPGLLLLGWAALQLVPLPPTLVAALNLTRPLPGAPEADWRPISVSVLDTRRGLAFLGAMLLLHLVASGTYQSRSATRRFVDGVRMLGLLLSIVAFVQTASRTKAIYGLFHPLEGTAEWSFGPFINRNHFATYMLMAAPLAFVVVGSAYRAYRGRVGLRTNARRWLVGVSTPEGIAFVYAAIPALACVAALLATLSRGALVAFAGGLVLAGLVAAQRGRLPGWLLALVFGAATVSWFGLERIEARFARSEHDAPARTAVWSDTLGRMQGRAVSGHGFNAFGASVSRTTSWDLPKGATPWIEPYETSIAGVERAGYHAPAGSSYAWYREAHNDYLQVFAETGFVGLALALWAAWRSLARARSDPWLLAAVSGVLLHAFGEFGLQIPAVAALFVCVTALRRVADL